MISLGITGISLIFGLPFFFLFLFIPLLPFWRTQKPRMQCPVCGWRTTGKERFCPYDGTALVQSEGY